MEMKKIVVFLCIIYTSCSNRTNSDYLAIINNDTIYKEFVDSIIEPQINALRQRTLNSIINNDLVSIEANKQDLTRIEFLNQMFSEIDSNNFSASEITDKKRLLFDSLITALKKENFVLNKLESEIQNSSFLNNLDAYIVGENSGKQITVFYDYDCHSCMESFNILKDLIGENKNIQFKFVYYSSYISKKAYVVDAAAEQGKFLQMIELMSDLKADFNDSIAIALAQNCDLNINTFRQDYSNKNYLKKHLNNKPIIKKLGIYTVPTYVYNDIAFNSIKELEVFLKSN